MITAKSIREKADKDLANLRKRCKHKELTEWMEFQWAIAHGSGFDVQLCKRCEETIHTKTSCIICGKTIQDKGILKGNGKNLAIGASYCKTCVNRSKKEHWDYNTGKWKPLPFDYTAIFEHGFDSNKK